MTFGKIFFNSMEFGRDFLLELCFQNIKFFRAGSEMDFLLVWKVRLKY